MDRRLDRASHPKLGPIVFLVAHIETPGQEVLRRFEIPSFGPLVIPAVILGASQDIPVTGPTFPPDLIQSLRYLPKVATLRVVAHELVSHIDRPRFDRILLVVLDRLGLFGLPAPVILADRWGFITNTINITINRSPPTRSARGVRFSVFILWVQCTVFIGHP